MSVISKIKLPNGTTYNITDGRGMFVGKCSSSAASRTKEIVISSEQDFTLRVGAVIAVLFTYTNTCLSVSTAPVQFNVNGTGAKPVCYGIETPAIGDNPMAYGTANFYHYYVYNTAGAWVWVGQNKELNTTYSGMTNSQITQGTSTTNELISPANLKFGVQTWETPTDQSPVKDSTNSVSSGYVYNMSNSLINQVDNGAKNRLPFRIEDIKQQNTSGTWSGNTFTHTTGVSFTINDDYSITVNGTATGANAAFVLSPNGKFSIETGEWVLSGTPSGGSTTSYNIAIEGTVSDIGNSVEFSGCTNKFVRIYIVNGTTVNNLIFKPMICSHADWSISQAYAQYCPSLQQLYNGLVIPVKTSNAVSDLNDAYEVGLYFYQNSALNKPSSSGGVVLTLQNQTNGRAYSKQIAFVNSNAFSATNFPIYARESNSSGVFSDWVQFSPLTSA